MLTEQGPLRKHLMGWALARLTNVDSVEKRRNQQRIFGGEVLINTKCHGLASCAVATPGLDSKQRFSMFEPFSFPSLLLSVRYFVCTNTSPPDEEDRFQS
ncbi:hypothetical protein J6590_048585 [Homalodisca vitripennis]|nr:hypothetical protein J6590_048585 [Homalodisca vitripennis]